MSDKSWSWSSVSVFTRQVLWSSLFPVCTSMLFCPLLKMFHKVSSGRAGTELPWDITSLLEERITRSQDMELLCCMSDILEWDSPRQSWESFQELDEQLSYRGRYERCWMRNWRRLIYKSVLSDSIIHKDLMFKNSLHFNLHWNL